MIAAIYSCKSSAAGGPMSNQLSLGPNDATENYHELARAPRPSRPVIVVEYEGWPVLLAIDVAIGEPGRERKLFEIGRLGEFNFAENVQAGELISIRARHLPSGEI